MTREEEVKQAAYSQYCNSESVCFTLMCDSFKQGAEWADENPKPGLIDLSQVWHPVEEDPETGRKVVAINKKGISFSGVYWPYDVKGYTPKYPGVYWNGGGCMQGARLLDWQEAIKWAYIEDLLPKGGQS